MAAESYLAIDLGAESGRAILGTLEKGRLSLVELHRFPNPGIRTVGGLHWDVLRLFAEMKTGLSKAAQYKPASLGVDTWGVDYALLDRDGKLVANPHHYRDSRTNGMIDAVTKIVPREKIFELTGLQFMELNTLFQLYSMKDSAALEQADMLLMMPDLFHYWFSGNKVCESSDASTTQFFNPRERDWARGLLDKLGLPSNILPKIVPPASEVGCLLSYVAEECGVSPIAVIAPASHDTGSAVAAVPAGRGAWAYLSSGTWSVLGAETNRPYVTTATLERNFTNEGGAWGTTRLLKNICGMWLLEECRRDWARSGIETSYDELLAAAAAETPFRSLIDVTDPGFVAPGDMPARIADHCANLDQPRPETVGQFARTIFEGLALAYRQVISDLAAITAGPRAETLHVVGGGSRNKLLCQYTADAAGIPVIAGPVEATAIGNVLLQAMALGRIGSREELRDIVRRSFELKIYEPTGEGWQEAAERLHQAVKSRTRIP